jgi:hypothetical protein
MSLVTVSENKVTDDNTHSKEVPYTIIKKKNCLRIQNMNIKVTSRKYINVQNTSNQTTVEVTQHNLA